MSGALMNTPEKNRQGPQQSVKRMHRDGTQFSVYDDHGTTHFRQEERRSAEETHRARGFFFGERYDQGRMHSVITHDEPALYAHHDCYANV